MAEIGGGCTCSPTPKLISPPPRSRMMVVSACSKKSNQIVKIVVDHDKTAD